MNPAFTLPVVTLPFGKHKGTPLVEVPADYLLWVLKECKLSSGLRLSIGNELRRRSVETPAPPPLKHPPRCDRCTSDLFHVGWMEDRSGKRRIRASCSCGRFLTFLPQNELWIALANNNASETAILDVLTRLEDLGINLQSDGERVWVHYEDTQARALRPTSNDPAVFAPVGPLDRQEDRMTPIRRDEVVLRSTSAVMRADAANSRKGIR